MNPQAGRDDSRDEECVLLVTTDRGRHEVTACCARSATTGVHEGMTAAHARALLQGRQVWVGEHTPAQDAERLHRLACWMQRFSPIVATDPPDGLLLDIAGCERVFEGERRLVEKADAALKRLGLIARLATAPTFGCARALARFGAARIVPVARGRVRESLAPLPIVALRIDDGIETALNDVGIERVGDLFRLPREDLAARYGVELLRRLDQATGEAAETITPVTPVQPLEAVRMFDGPVTSAEAISWTVRELLDTLTAEVQRRGWGVCTMDIELRRMDLKPERVTIRLTHASRSVKHLWTLIQPRLERSNLGYGVEAVVLRALRTERIRHGQGGFWPEMESIEAGNGDARLGEFVDRVMERFGSRAVTAVQVRESFVPERAFPFAPLQEQGLSPGGRVPAKSGPRIHSAPRPSLLFETPEPVQVIALVPDGPPARLQWRGRDYAIRTSVGPERIALPWWNRGTVNGTTAGDAAVPAVRDYHRVQDEQGRWIWVFRDGSSGAWFVHGLWS